MSEFIHNTPDERKEMLKEILLRLHQGEQPEALKRQLSTLLHAIPYQEVVAVEEELIAQGLLSTDEIQLFCDHHSEILEGAIDVSGAKEVPAGHPMDTFRAENVALGEVVSEYYALAKEVKEQHCERPLSELLLSLRSIFNRLMDVDKHYLRKEYLLFPYLEQHGVTGPPVVMWGKHDEIRKLLKSAIAVLSGETSDMASLRAHIVETFDPAVEMLDSMITKEEMILFPMTLDLLSEAEWYHIYQETPEFGYCLYDPQTVWKPDVEADNLHFQYESHDAIRLSTGAFSVAELEALLIHLPIDITFVDKDDKVRFYSHSPKRVFARNRSIIGRDVRMCHPPESVHVVETILADFKSGRQNCAKFWIGNFRGRFIYIEYTAVRDPEGNYLGVVECSQDITELRQLEGSRTLLNYD